MSDKKISELDPADALSGDEMIEVVQEGENRRATAADIAALGGGPGAGLPPGGTAGQVLGKATAADFDVAWMNPAGGGGGGGITSPTIQRIITSHDPNEPTVEGDLLIVLPTPRVVAAAYSEQTYGDADSVSSVAVQIPLEAKEGDLIVLLVGSAHTPSPPSGFTLIATRDSTRTLSPGGLGRSTAYQKVASAEDAGSVIEVPQSSLGRMGAVAVVVRSPSGSVSVVGSSSDSFASPAVEENVYHPIPHAVAPTTGCLGLVMYACAFARTDVSTEVEWPPGWVPITPDTVPISPAWKQLRHWAGYKQLRSGESTADYGECLHSATTHDSSSIAVVLRGL